MRNSLSIQIMHEGLTVLRANSRAGSGTIAAFTLGSGDSGMMVCGQGGPQTGRNWTGSSGKVHPNRGKASVSMFRSTIFSNLRPRLSVDNVVSESEAWSCDPVRCAADLKSVLHAAWLSAGNAAFGHNLPEGSVVEVNLHAVPYP
jgi:hypothetical protein